MALGEIMGVFTKVNVIHIVRGHLDTLVDRSAAAGPIRSLRDHALFFGGPALVVGLCHWRGINLSASVNALVAALSILTGLLFNLLVVLTAQRPAQPSALERKLRVETYFNIAYSIIVAMVALVFLLVLANESQNALFQAVVRDVSVFLLVHFGLTLLMAVKRMHALLINTL